MLKLKTMQFHENPYFKELYKALKMVKAELQKGIDTQMNIYFESEPPDYAGEDLRYADMLKRNAQQRWKFLHNHILLKLGGIADIKGAIEKIYECKSYE